MILREPVGRREQFFLPRVGPAPRKAGIPDRRKYRKPFLRTAFCIFRVADSPVSQALPSGCVRFGGMEPGPLQDAMRGAVSGSVSAVMCRTPGCCFAQAHNARTVSVM
jgi:hypothetical protein